jgi:RluA family pseudouridine synthase
MTTVIYSDDDLLVVDKPPGIACAPGGWGQAPPSLFKTLEQDFGRLWLIHRLDKATSGLMVFARNAAAHREVSVQFESRRVVKTYHAIVCGVPSWEERSTRAPLRADVGHSHRTAVDRERGVPAQTHFQVEERFQAHALLVAKPETGRTHQVRAHAAALGFPLLADRLYGAPATELILRTALHAASLELSYAGQMFHWVAPYPADFVHALEELRAG